METNQIEHAAVSPYAAGLSLALHLKSVNLDSETETLVDPSIIKNATMSGCGSVSCSSS